MLGGRHAPGRAERRDRCARAVGPARVRDPARAERRRQVAQGGSLHHAHDARACRGPGCGPRAPPPGAPGPARTRWDHAAQPRPARRDHQLLSCIRRTAAAPRACAQRPTRPFERLAPLAWRGLPSPPTAGSSGTIAASPPSMPRTACPGSTLCTLRRGRGPPGVMTTSSGLPGSSGVLLMVVPLSAWMPYGGYKGALCGDM